jgi:hypothetical protein
MPRRKDIPSTQKHKKKKKKQQMKKLVRAIISHTEVNVDEEWLRWCAYQTVICCQ